MRNVYGTYQNVNRFSDMISVKVFRTDPYISHISYINTYHISLQMVPNEYEFI